MCDIFNMTEIKNKSRVTQTALVLTWVKQNSAFISSEITRFLALQEPQKKCSLGISGASSTLEISFGVSKGNSAPGPPTYSKSAGLQPCEFEHKFPKKIKVHGHVCLWGGELQEYPTHCNDSNQSENFRGKKEKETKWRPGNARIACYNQMLT